MHSGSRAPSVRTVQICLFVEQAVLRRCTQRVCRSCRIRRLSVPQHVVHGSYCQILAADNTSGLLHCICCFEKRARNNEQDETPGVREAGMNTAPDLSPNRVPGCSWTHNRSPISLMRANRPQSLQQSRLEGSMTQAHPNLNGWMRQAAISESRTLMQHTPGATPDRDPLRLRVALPHPPSLRLLRHQIARGRGFLERWAIGRSAPDRCFGVPQQQAVMSQRRGTAAELEVGASAAGTGAVAASAWSPPGP